mmetsp:Transcript_3041/g.9263  ORF Transcript_3041/g.9263 Transcript_3041/m.9263 type:complete len:136 (+) Transcript_3041:33-440(+)
MQNKKEPTATERRPETRALRQVSTMCEGSGTKSLVDKPEPAAGAVDADAQGVDKPEPVTISSILRLIAAISVALTFISHKLISDDQPLYDRPFVACVVCATVGSFILLLVYLSMQLQNLVAAGSAVAPHPVQARP